MISARGAIGLILCLSLVSCHRLSPLEQKIVGAWSWTYIEGHGRMEFHADHTLRVGFAREELYGYRHFWQSHFVFLDSGTWHLEHDVLVSETNNQLLLDSFRRSSMEKPPFQIR